jgi:hypothetical protein
LTKKLETVLGESRSDWAMPVCRRIWGKLEELANNRFLSPQHASRWYNLAGFCLRPGFGDPLDRYRVESLWKIATTPSAQGAVFDSGADFWIMMRRVAGGLPSGLQLTLWNRLRPVLIASKGKSQPKPAANELVEMYRTAGSLERLDTKVKDQLGSSILGQLSKASSSGHLLWALTRLGARQLLYGPINSVLHPQIVEKWVEQLLLLQPKNDAEKVNWAFCLAQWGRLTGQRSIDLSDDTRNNILAVLRDMKIPEHWIQMVEEVSVLDSAEKSQLFGESLPIGLKLAGG